MRPIKVLWLKKIVDALILWVQEDYNIKVADNREEDSFLYRYLNGNTEGDYDFYVQAKAIFLRDQKSPRQIRTSLMFNKDIKGTPHVHVREPAKSKGQYNSIGGGMGNIIMNTDGSYNDTFRDSKRASYDIVITSDNPLDTVLISEVLYALLWGANSTLSDEFGLFDLGMKELMMENHLVPIQLYIKAITMDVQFDNEMMGLTGDIPVIDINLNNPTILNSNIYE